MIIEMYRLTRNPLCIHQYNAMGCYDRIIRNHAILCSRKFGIPDSIYKLHYHTHNSMQI